MVSRLHQQHDVALIREPRQRAVAARICAVDCGLTGRARAWVYRHDGAVRGLLDTLEHTDSSTEFDESGLPYQGPWRRFDGTPTIFLEVLSA